MGEQVCLGFSKSPHARTRGIGPVPRNETISQDYGNCSVGGMTHPFPDQVGGCSAVLAPLVSRIAAHVFAAERLHGDDTTVPVLAKGKTHTGRCWVYVRDDRPFGGPDPPAAMCYYSRDRAGAPRQAHLADY